MIAKFCVRATSSSDAIMLAESEDNVLSPHQDLHTACSSCDCQLSELSTKEVLQMGQLMTALTVWQGLPPSLHIISNITLPMLLQPDIITTVLYEPHTVELHYWSECLLTHLAINTDSLD